MEEGNTATATARKAFTVWGEPKGKGRPRFAAGMRPYTPDGTRAYEEMIAWEYSRQCGGMLTEHGLVRMTIKAYHGIPKAARRKDRALMASGVIRPLKKPDMDKIAKIYADALNGLAYHDDTQIVVLSCMKFYSDEPRVDVVLEEAQPSGVSGSVRECPKVSRNGRAHG
jgi:Holliday junction resolvase RusA-like endonuclease